ncbi:MAG TPA: LytTR family DNA-binding domain-containing protein [Candidatus Acidoferrales bacterium]|nr:LytTR family DNA-binding domain-containing protein [Candidatus Acidoferrales bacterium]
MDILIVDDEAPARLRLIQLLAEMPDHRIVAEAEDGAQALAVCSAQAVDVVLLDVRMPGLDGLQTARLLAAQTDPPAVVFVTAYADHALAAFEVQATDYLVKPVRRERLAQALARVAQQRGVRAEAAAGRQPRTHLCSRVRGAVHRIAVDRVRYFKAEQKYVTVHDGEREFLIDGALSGLAEEFAGRFLRVHRNALVSLRYLEGLQKLGLGYGVRLQGCDHVIPVSRRHMPGIRQHLRGRKP